MRSITRSNALTWWVIITSFGIHLERSGGKPASLDRNTPHVRQIDQIDQIIYILTCRYDIISRICLVQIQSRKHIPDHADHTAPTR